MNRLLSSRLNRKLVLLLTIIGLVFSMATIAFATEKDRAADQNDDMVSITLDGEKASANSDVSYTVDFYYDPDDAKATEYHMDGGTEIMLSTLFKKLGIDRSTADIEKLEFSDTSLVKFIKEGDDYRIVSLKPFTSSEKLIITFAEEDGNSSDIVIDVEDAVSDWYISGGDVLARFDDSTGTLTIRPKNSLGGADGEATFKQGIDGKANWKWNSVRSQIKKVEFQGTLHTASGINLNNMFHDCTNLEEVVGLDNFDTSVVGGLARMFSGCTSLKKVDLSSWTNEGTIQNMQNMFRDSGVETVKMPGSDFTVKENALLAGMFQDCKSLKTVDFGTSDNHMDVTEAKTMTDMFSGCSALETLDVSTFGTLTHIQKMDGFVNGCTSLKTLIIDNLDNSCIGPYNSRHSASEANSAQTGAKEFGRMLDIHTCTALETLSAQNSKVWMCHNDRGLPGKEYYNASEKNSTYYFTDKVMEFKSDVGPTETIDSDRDYIDLITDRDGTNVYSTDPNQNPLPDAAKNINIKDGDLNTNGAGMLAPGIYTIGTEKRTEPAGPSMCDTYYRIAYIGEVPYRVEGVEDNDELLQVDGTDNTYISTQWMQWPTSGDYEIDLTTPIKITYEKAAVDMNGRKYDVQITINKITFKDLEYIPTDPGSARVQHDGNNYVGTDRGYYRPILQANKKDGVEFQNYVRINDPEEPWSPTNALSKGSGTDIEFTIEIVGAPDDTSFVFRGEDMDIAYSQEWINSTTDNCEDHLPIENNTYKAGEGEGFVLGNGNVTSTVKFAEHTGLVLVDGNKIMPTGTDPTTTWSEFTVKADAQGSDYTWTSGIACTTYALRNTKAQNAGTTKLQPKVLKELVNGTLDAEQFEFVLEEESKDPGDIPGPFKPDTTTLAVPQEKSNDASGNVVFDVMEFKSDEEDGYYPGTASDNTHNTYTYKYKVYEKVPDDAITISGYTIKDGIIYDETEHTVTIVIKCPENETEMIRGIKAEVYVDKTPGTGVTPDKVYWHQEKPCVDCSNGTPTDIAADKWYDDEGNEISDPNPFTLTNVKFKNIEVDPVKVRIPVEKILKGRPWKDSDEFAVALVLVASDTTTPMPEDTKTKDDLRYSEITINNQDEEGTTEGGRVIGYKDKFGEITYTIDDLVNASGTGIEEKTFTYDVRELQPSETTVPSIPGVTYDAQPDKVTVTVKLDKTDPTKPKLTYTVSYKDESGSTITIPNFTNTYDAEQTIYKMEAVKDYHDVTNGGEIPLKGGEFNFVLKPIGEYAEIAPMPKNTSGTGAKRTYEKSNEEDGDIQFEVESDPEDGLTFNYQALLDAGISDVALHSDDGVDFEYEMYEIIPDNAVNNNDGTWIYEDRESGIKYTYDGIHHTRKITVKIRTVTPSDPGEDPYDELYIEGHQDDHKVDFYIDKDGNEKPASSIPGYDPDKNHFKPDAEDLGAPIFLNYKEELPGEIEGDETYGLKNQTQTGEPKYDVIPENPIDKSTLKLVKPDVEGATISDDGKVVTIPGEGKYTLNDDGTITYEPAKDYVGDPTPITVEGTDTRGNTVQGQYIPHVVDPTEEATVKRTVHFTYEKKNGKKVVSNVTQTGTITRKALEVDPKTGEVTKWGPWSSYTFPAVKNPDKEAGPEWATKDVVPELTVNKPGEVPDVYVVYHKTGGTGTKSSGSSTGDQAMPYLIGAIMLLAAIAIAVMLIRRRRHGDQQ